jgi:hypothetical protein
VLFKKFCGFERIKKHGPKFRNLIGRHFKFVGQSVVEEFLVRKILASVMAVNVLNDRCSKNGISKALQFIGRGLRS